MPVDTIPMDTVLMGPWACHFVDACLASGRNSLHRLDEYSVTGLSISAFGYIAMAYLCSLVLYLLVEKPAMNLVALLVNGGQDRRR